MATPDSDRFGEIAIALGLITRPQLEAAIRKQQELQTRGAQSRLGEIFVLMKILAQTQVDRVLSAQQQRRQAAAEAPLPFQRLGPYELEQRLGSGMLGTVYRVRDGGSKNLVALKIFERGIARDAQTRQRLVKQIKVLTALDHANLVRVLDGGVLQDRPYMVMELITEESLEARLKRESRLPEKESIVIALQVAQALCYAHRMGHPHFNLKPQNILLARNVKVSDLGLAHAALGAAVIPQSGDVTGMPYYLSPEQTRGSKQLDPRSDFFSLGAILYHMLTGRPPFQADTGLEVFLRKLNADPLPNPKEAAPDLSQDVVKVVMKLMTRDPAGRYPSAVVLIEDLTQIAQGAPAPYTRLDLTASTVMNWDTASSKKARPEAPKRGGCFTGMALLSLALCVAWLL